MSHKKIVPSTPEEASLNSGPLAFAQQILVTLDSWPMSIGDSSMIFSL